MWSHYVKGRNGNVELRACRDETGTYITVGEPGHDPIEVDLDVARSALSMLIALQATTKVQPSRLP